MSTKKNCTCTNHEGPHFLYEDYTWKQRNIDILREWLKAVQDAEYKNAYALHEKYEEEEINRIEKKLTYMDAGQYPYDLLGEGYEEDLQWLSRNLLEQIIYEHSWNIMLWEASTERREARLKVKENILKQIGG